MLKVADVLQVLEAWYPLGLAESWDNVGLLLGDPQQPVQRLLTCLTLTPNVADEACEQSADLIVTHHPIFFRPVQRLTATSGESHLFRLARAGISVYSPHTAFDNAATGINMQLAQLLQLTQIQPIRPQTPPQSASTTALGSVPNELPVTLGAGRWGELPEAMSLRRLTNYLQQRGIEAGFEFGPTLGFVGPANLSCQRVALVCGAGGDFLDDLQTRPIDVLITGEARFHQYLAAETAGKGLILLGHYASERFALETLAQRLAQTFPSLAVWAATNEHDPFTPWNASPPGE